MDTKNHVQAEASASPQTEGSPSPAQADGCVWTEVSDEYGDVWETACGEASQFDVGGPKENKNRFCCYCGKTLIEARISRCEYCGECFPFPVNLHHSEDECAATIAEAQAAATASAQSQELDATVPSPEACNDRGIL